MQKQFNKFCENILLTKKQRDDAKVKYNGVCKKLHNAFYESEYAGHTKFLFGSYKKKTAIRPFTDNQDVDVLFKMPEEDFESFDRQEKGQSALLQLVKKTLLDSKYALGEKPKAWGKVILIKTSDGTHNIELLPAFEQSDGTFVIPNTENGGTWEIFNPRKELKFFGDSNSKSNGLTAELSRMIKRWKQGVSSLSIKSFEIENYVIDFLKTADLSNVYHPHIVRDFFVFLEEQLDYDNKNYAKTARKRAEKALRYEDSEKFESATDEWIKIFGTSFPSRASIYKNIYTERSVTTEMFIEELYTVKVDPAYHLKIDCEVEQNGFRKGLLSALSFLQKNKSLTFFIEKTNVPQPFSVKWKVRNFGKEAEDIRQLRGEISDDKGERQKTERTKYRGEHFVECYIIKDGECVARDKIMVPIGF